MVANCYWKARLSEPQNEGDDDSEVSLCIQEDVEKMNVTFTFEDYSEADDNLLIVQFRKLTSVLKERTQKLIMRRGGSSM
jgi:hypothetical protein